MDIRTPSIKHKSRRSILKLRGAVRQWVRLTKLVPRWKLENHRQTAPDGQTAMAVPAEEAVPALCTRILSYETIEISTKQRIYPFIPSKERQADGSLTFEAVPGAPRPVWVARQDKREYISGQHRQLRSSEEGRAHVLGG